jgi:outer membrane protein OmpA-like peptidoglycan-associated protein
MAEHEAKPEEHASHGGGGHGPPHGGGAHEEHEGAPEWLISFADNVALMMGFFVILLAMNMGPKGSHAAPPEPSSYTGPETPDMVDFVISIREAFGNPINPNGTNPEEEVFRKRIIERTGGEGTDIAPKGRHQETQASRPSDYRQITAVIPFDDNSTTLSPSGREIIIDTAKHIRDQGWVIEVRGHVSQFEAKRALQTGMKLSFDRGLVVTQALVEGGVKRENLRVVACADHDQIVSKTFERESAKTNSRVEIVVTNETVQPDAFATRGKGETGGEKAVPADTPANSKPESGKSESPEKKPGHGGK